MQKLGDKTEARKLALEAGVKVVPGTSEPVPGVEAAEEFAAEAGYPVMLKAAMGGGGRGMRIVRRSAPAFYAGDQIRFFDR
jgi:pyruvate carboxylase